MKVLGLYLVNKLDVFQQGLADLFEVIFSMSHLSCTAVFVEVTVFFNICRLASTDNLRGARCYLLCILGMLLD